MPPTDVGRRPRPISHRAARGRFWPGALAFGTPEIPGDPARLRGRPGRRPLVPWAAPQEIVQLSRDAQWRRGADLRLGRGLENLQAEVALHFAHYNLVRVHKTLRVTPAMAASVTDRLWSLEELVGRTSK